MARDDDKRFRVVEKQSTGMTAFDKVLQDRSTGVLYLFHLEGYAGGLTVLVDRDGKPLYQPTG